MKQRKTKQKNVKIPQHLNKTVATEEGIQEVSRKHNLLLILIILIAGIIAYSNSFDCSFHFDDMFVSFNDLNPDSATIGEWIHPFPNRPLGTLTFVANYYVNKLDVRGYHIVNLMIHLINALLVWWLTLITFSTPVMKDTSISRHKNIIAFLTGLLFVTHPLATQSVTYIIQRFASLATLFYLLSLILFVRARLWKGDKYISRLLFGASVVLAVCAILTKEIAFTLPFAVILYEFCFIKTSSWKPDLKNKNLLVLFFILAFFIFFFFGHFSLTIFDTKPPDLGYSYSISMKEYFLTQFSVILTYIRLFFLPFNQNLDYDYPLSTGFFQLKTFFSFLTLLGIVSAGVLLFKRYRLISFGIFWFFITLSVESSIIPISQDVIYEHRTYLPGFGFFIAFTGAFFYFFKEKYFKTALITILIIAAINMALTYQRNKIWKNDYTLWADCQRKSPNKTRANDNLGIALLDIEGKVNEAIYYFDKAISLNPNDAKSYNNRGNAYAKLGKYQLAIEDFNKSIILGPGNAETYSNMGILNIKLGQYQRALEDFNKALSLNPKNAGAYYIRGSVYAELRQFNLALTDFNEAIRLAPNNTDAYNNRAILYLYLGKKELGCPDVQKACSLGNCQGLKWAKDKGFCH